MTDFSSYLDFGLGGNTASGLDNLGGYWAGAKDAAGNLLDSAGQALAWEAVAQHADKLLDNGPLDGVLYDYQAPDTGGVLGYGAHDRSMSVKPLGWGVLAASAAFVGWWVLR